MLEFVAESCVADPAHRRGNSTHKVRKRPGLERLGTLPKPIWQPGQACIRRGDYGEIAVSLAIFSGTTCHTGASQAT